jgi:hypothetical protein
MIADCQSGIHRAIDDWGIARFDWVNAAMRAMRQ